MTDESNDDEQADKLQTTIKTISAKFVQAPLIRGDLFKDTLVFFALA